MVDVDQARDLPDRGSIASELVGMNCLWDVIFIQEAGQEGLRSFSVSVSLKKNVKHEAVLVHRSPEPVANTINACTDLIQVPSGTPSGFPMAQVFREEGSEFKTPFAEGFMADLNAALVEQFLDIAVTEGEAVVQPDGVLNDGHRETMAVGFRVGHGKSAYPDPVKATQPLDVLHSVEHRKLAKGGTVTPKLVGVHRDGDAIVTQQPDEEGLGRSSVPVPLQEHVQDGTVLIDGPPQPVCDATDVHVHFVEMPPGTPPGFPVAEALSKFFAEIEAPRPHGFT